ncbi:MAG: peptide deformylase [Deltaproteobacteria bacterium]|nr:peptide deformylase [Deltaproteobacteria bacterium]
MARIGRREFVALTSAAGASVLTGCATRRCPTTVATPAGAPAFDWLPDERALIDAPGNEFDIVVRKSPNARVLRTRARPAPAGLDLTGVERRMIGAMDRAGGVGIAGPQVGLSLRVAVLKLDYKTDDPRVVFVRNPVIVERSGETVDGYEGCLSVPDVGGLVRRSRWIRVEHQSIDGTLETTEAEAYNAVLWQHELDHLDGVLYLDKLLGELKPMDEVRRLRKELEQAGSGTSDAPPPADQSLRTGDHLEGASLLIATRV